MSIEDRWAMDEPPLIISVDRNREKTAEGKELAQLLRNDENLTEKDCKFIEDLCASEKSAKEMIEYMKKNPNAGYNEVYLTAVDLYKQNNQ